MMLINFSELLVSIVIVILIYFSVVAILAVIDKFKLLIKFFNEE
jgi:biopolymer transport protein ExbB/TolQ